jgi:hypothetical protein
LIGARPSRRGGLAVVLGAVALGLPLITASPAAALQNTVTVIQHSPPPGAVAGDQLPLSASFTFTCATINECSNRVERLVYVDHRGVSRTLQRTVTGSNTLTVQDVWAVAVPAADVGFPALQYHFEGSMDDRNPVTGQTTSVSDRWPRTGEQSINVDDVIRLSYVYSDGRPGANIPVEISADRGGASWGAVTNASGQLSFIVPRTSAWVQGLASGERQGSVLVWAFDGPRPSTGAQPGAPVARSGQGRVLGVQLNFGRPELPVVWGWQDMPFLLKAMTDYTYNAADLHMTASSSAGDPGDSQCWDTPRDGATGATEWRECINTYNGGTTATPIAENLGGGVDTIGSYRYTNNIQTSTSRSVKLGATWVEASGKTTAEKTNEAVNDTGYFGPNVKHGFAVNLDYVFVEHSQCPYNPNGSIDWAACHKEYEYKAHGWGGGVTVTAYPLWDYWDQACNPAGGHCNDYTQHLYAEFTVTTSVTRAFERSFTAGTTYDPVDLHAETVQSKNVDSQREVKVSFKATPTKTKANQYFFVKSGAQSGRRPTTDPTLVYTAASDAELSNTAAQDPSLPCVFCPSQGLPPL